MTTEKQTGIERLRTLYAIMCGVPEERVNLSYWRGDNTSAENFLKYSCGTTACTVGWACAYPEFIEQGLTYESSSIGSGPVFREKNRIGLFGWGAVERFFDLNDPESTALFMPSRGDMGLCVESERRKHAHFARFGESSMSSVLSDRQVALRRIRRFLLSKGVITPERNAELALKDGAPA